MKTSKYIDDVCLVGDKRKFISALIIPNYELLKKWASERGLAIENNEDLLANEAVNKLIEQEIEARQATFAHYEIVKKFVMLPQPLTIDNGELTPSLKIKRSVVEKKYGEMIDAMYEE